MRTNHLTQLLELLLLIGINGCTIRFSRPLGIVAMRLLRLAHKRDVFLLGLLRRNLRVDLLLPGVVFVLALHTAPVSITVQQGGLAA